MARFSEVFHVTRTADDDWFDPHLTIDTKLFVDPLLVLIAGDPWTSGHDRLLAHFEHCYQLVAQSRSPASVPGRVAQRLLTFPEPAEFCLGYTAEGTSGAGSGARFARQMADGIAVAMAAGLDHPEHIEEIGILNEGVGADRISDAVCNVLKADFIAYTQRVCQRHHVPMAAHRVRNTRVFPAEGRWLTETVLLPTNPSTGKPVILVPARLLNDLPTLNADDWFDSTFNQDIRDQLNLGVGRRVRKADIVAWARRYPDRVRAWARRQTTRPDLRGYNFGQDPLGVVQWDQEPVTFARLHPLATPTPPTDSDSLWAIVEEMLQMYRRFIELQRGWSLLWNSDGSEKPEEAAQLLFMGMAHHYLRQYGIEVDREVELGRGPVDFKISAGSRARLLIEIKKAHNGRFWNGLEAQLMSYLKSDDCDHGVFVAVRYRSNRASEIRMRELPNRVAAVAGRTGNVVDYAAIDARPQVSASTI